MISQSNGKIFLAGERGHSERDWFRSYNTFNFGLYQHEHKTPFGPLYVLNDDTLAGGRSLMQCMERDSDVILIPTVGAIHYSDNTGNETLIEAGQAQLHFVRKGTTFEISNPYEQGLVNFIQIWIARDGMVSSTATPQLFPFDLEQNKNKLIQIIAVNADVQHHAGVFSVSIGKFSGRQETVYNVSKAETGVFFFVLQGAFEVQYRLLEARDGLSLWNIPEIELEAFSNDAIILAIEVPMSSDNV